MRALRIPAGTSATRGLLGWGIAAARAGTGAALVARPHLARATTGTERLLARTVGVRDLVLGLGTARALARGQADPWLRAGLLSDLADVAVCVRSRNDVGRATVVLGVALALPFVAAAAAAELARRR